MNIDISICNHLLPHVFGYCSGMDNYRHQHSHTSRQECLGHLITKLFTLKADPRAESRAISKTVVSGYY